MRKVEPFHTGNICHLCQFCTHRKEDNIWTCDAYPELIPLEIRLMNVDHRMPYIDDHGVQFELREDLAPVKYEFFLQDFFGDCWDRTEEEIRQEKERYIEQIEDILRKREAQSVAVPTTPRT